MQMPIMAKDVFIARFIASGGRGVKCVLTGAHPMAFVLHKNRSAPGDRDT